MSLAIRRRWRRYLLGSWGVYWAGLAVVKLGPFALAARRAAGLPETKGTISAGFDNAVFKLSAVADGVTVWAGSAHIGTIALWVAGPPLLLWLGWMGLRPSRDADAANDVLPATQPHLVREDARGERRAAELRAADDTLPSAPRSAEKQVDRLGQR